MAHPASESLYSPAAILRSGRHARRCRPVSTGTHHYIAYVRGNMQSGMGWSEIKR